MDFVIADVTRPIISVTQLQANGIIASLAKRGCHLRTSQGKWVTLKRGEDTLSYFCPQGISEAPQKTVSKAPLQAPVQVIYVSLGEEESSSSSGWKGHERVGREDPYGDITLSHLLAVTQGNKSSPEKREGTESSVSPFSPIGIKEALPLAQDASTGSSVQMSVAPVVMSRSDHWEVRGNVLIRHHRSLRQHLFNPGNAKDMPCELSDLQALRKTVFMDGNQRVIGTKIDDWGTQGGSKIQGEAWYGQTRFYFKEVEGKIFKALNIKDIESELIGSETVSEIPLPVMVRHGHTSEDHSDYWEVKGRFWIRHHVRPRATLFVPQEHSPGGPDVSMLSSIRETRFNLADHPPQASEHRKITPCLMIGASTLVMSVSTSLPGSRCSG
jgi:hypothetical protein